MARLVGHLLRQATCLRYVSEDHYDSKQLTIWAANRGRGVLDGELPPITADQDGVAAKPS